MPRHQEPRPLRSLTSSMCGVYSQSKHNLGSLSLRTFRRRIRSDHWEYGLPKLKVDVCDTCNQWGRQLLRLALRSMATFRQTLHAIDGTYMVEFDETVLPTLPLVAVQQVQYTYVEVFLKCVGRRQLRVSHTPATNRITRGSIAKHPPPTGKCGKGAENTP